MRRPCSEFERRGEAGYALVFALAVMLVVLAVGMRYLAVVQSRHTVSDNEKAGLQAAMIADAGVQRAVRELSQDMTWHGSFTNEPFAEGTYSARVLSRSPGRVVLLAEAAFGPITRRRVATVYTPDGTGNMHIWAGCYGTGANEWLNKRNLIDSAEGETGTYANHWLSGWGNQMSLTGFGSDLRSVSLSKVEIVISGYVRREVVDDYLEVCWRLNGSGTTGQWHAWPCADLALHDQAHPGRMYLDVTDDPPPGGWRWEHFAHDTDLELRFASVRVGWLDFVELYADCAGFRVTWNAGL